VQDESRFRQWLKEKIKRSRWVTRTTDNVETVARRLGVQASVLVEAQRELTEERQAQGRQPAALGNRSKRSAKRQIIEVEMPEAVFGDWQEYCRQRDMVPSVLLRSLVHTLLSGPENPMWVGRTWVYRGKRLVLDGYKEQMKLKGWPWSVKSQITHGAMRALTIRADLLGCTPTALMRGSVIDLLEGRTKRLNVTPGVSSMWDDENRYWTGREPGA
jgi:hypothetical protein